MKISSHRMYSASPQRTCVSVFVIKIDSKIVALRSKSKGQGLTCPSFCCNSSLRLAVCAPQPDIMGQPHHHPDTGAAVEGEELDPGLHTDSDGLHIVPGQSWKPTFAKIKVSQ